MIAIMYRFVGITNYRPFVCRVSNIRCISSDISTPQIHKTIEDIPGPTQFPLVGSVFSLIFFKGGPAKSRIYLPAERVREYGKIYKERFGPANELVFLADPNEVETVLRNESSYPQRFKNPVFEYFWEKNNRRPGVFFADGQEWYKYRHAMSRRMLVPRSIHKHAPELNNIAYDFIEQLRGLRVFDKPERNNEVGNIDYMLFKWAFESATFVIFERRFGSIGEDADPTIEEFIRATNIMLRSVIPAAYYPAKLFDYYQPRSYRKFESSFNRVYELTRSFIDLEINRVNDEIHDSEDSEVSLLKHLLLNENLTIEDVHHSVVDLMFAGVDTTSNTMQWILYELAKHPDKQATLCDEVKSIIPAYPAAVSATHLQSLPYLKAVVKETLRMHPLFVELPRMLPEDIVLSGYLLPAGTSLAILSHVMGRDGDLFEQPDMFVPERWLKTTKSRLELHKFSSLPFGFGRRMCVGRRLAELELHILLVHLVFNFYFLYPENTNLYPIARATLIPHEPVRVKFIDRMHKKDSY